MVYYIQCLFCYVTRFAKLKALGRSILEKNPDAQDVKDKLRRLEEEEKAVEKLWQQRKKQLDDAYNLEVLYYRAACLLLSTTPYWHKTFVVFLAFSVYFFRRYVLIILFAPQLTSF